MERRCAARVRVKNSRRELIFKPHTPETDWLGNGKKANKDTSAKKLCKE